VFRLERLPDAPPDTVAVRLHALVSDALTSEKGYRLSDAHMLAAYPGFRITCISRVMQFGFRKGKNASQCVYVIEEANGRDTTRIKYNYGAWNNYIPGKE
jgi:hypothetical protein